MRLPWSVFALAACLGPVIVLAPQTRLYGWVTVPMAIVAITTMFGAARRDVVAPVGWRVLALGYCVWYVGAVVNLVGRLGGWPTVPAAGAVHLVGFLFLAAGIALLARGAGGQHWRAGALEGAIVSVGLGLVVVIVAVGPALAIDDPGSPSLMAMGFLVGDLVLVGQMVYLLSSTGWRSQSYWMGGTGAAVLLACDGVAVFIDPENGVGRLVAVGMVVSCQLWAAAAVHPASTERFDRPTSDGLTPLRLGVLALALLLPAALLAVLAWQTRDGADPSWARGWMLWSIAVAGAVMSLLVAFRVWVAGTATRRSVRTLQELSRTLAHQAAHDPLTGLANRAASRARLATVLRGAQRESHPVGVLFIDLDGFKAVNDTYGHRAGDEVLRTVARRLTTGITDFDFVGRLGGDEFVVATWQFGDERTLLDRAETVVAQLSVPIDVDGEVIVLGASVGVASTPDGTASADTLLHEADTAAYRAKAVGRGCAVLFDDRLREQLRWRADLESDLREAISSGGLELYYQPVIELRSGIIRGLEALARWNRPRHGPVSPSVFVEVAEDSDLVCDLGRWALRTATAQQVRWVELFDGPGPMVGVNIAPRHLAHPSILIDVQDALRESGCCPGRLTIEVTETDLCSSPTAIANLHRLRAMGLHAAIDDFGTGWTSINQLQTLPCDILKVDRSLVVSTAPGATELLALAVSVAHAFGQDVVAEGVETAEQEHAVRAAGFDFVQGWRWSRAVPAGRVDELICDAQTRRLLGERAEVDPVTAPPGPGGG